MTAPVFVDANVFVYANQPCEALKQPVAVSWIERLWSEKIGRTSMQALNECYSVLTRKADPRLPHDRAWEYVRKLMAWRPYPVTARLAKRAREIQKQHRLNWWDCLIVAAAQAQRCSILLTEDLQDSAMYGDVRVRNPFAPAVCDSTLPEMYGRDRAWVLRRRWRNRSLRPWPRATTENQVGL